MSVSEIVINDRSYHMVSIPALPAARILIKLQKVIMPVLSAGSIKDALDTDAGNFLQVVSDNLSVDMIEDIVIPMFDLCKLTATVPGERDPRFINSEAQINVLFPKAADLVDLAELTAKVMEAQFSDFLERLKARLPKEPEKKAEGESYVTVDGEMFSHPRRVAE